MAEDASPNPHNLPEFTVSQLSGALKKTIETAFDRVRVRGEISGFKRAASGHLYFALKDADALIDACCWKAQAQRLALRPEEGMEVIATGKLTTYPGRSKYQIIVETLTLAGKGALLALIEARKQALAAEGLFDPARKRALPLLPGVIGVVTSPTGAVIRDILHRLADRFPRRVLVWPVLVQGEGAAAQISAAITGFNALDPHGPVPRPDLLIVARGGGSVEDLMAFNEENVVRAAAASVIPLISAVGHETDTTLIDFAADRRAPTPTAAAEMAVPVRAELIARLREGERRLLDALNRQQRERRLRIDALGRGLGDPAARIAQAGQRLDDRAERLITAWRQSRDRWAGRIAALAARLPHPRAQALLAATRLGASGRALDAALIRRRDGAAAGLGQGRQRLEQLAGRLDRAIRARLDQAMIGVAGRGRLLETLSYRAVLGRGFVLVRDTQGQPVPRRAGLTAGQALRLQFADDNLDVQVTGAAPGQAPPPPGPAAKPAPTKRPTAPQTRQPGLFD